MLHIDLLSLSLFAITKKCILIKQHYTYDMIIENNELNGLSGKPTDADYKVAGLLAKALDALSTAIYQGGYIIDCNNKNFYYVFRNIPFIEHSREEFKTKGFEFYQEYTPPGELESLKKIYASTLSFWNNIPINEREGYVLSFDCHIKDDGRLKLINHRYIPVMFDKINDCWLIICLLSMSPFREPGNAMICKKGYEYYWEYSKSSPANPWKRKDKAVLTNEEKDVLVYSAQGWTEKEIADQLLYRHINTVKTRKKNIFDKIGARNTVEALLLATTLFYI